MVKDGGALARATSIGPSAATGLEVSADTAGGSLGFLRNKDVGFEVRCGWWHSSLRHHAARRAAITIFYRLYGER